MQRVAARICWSRLARRGGILAGAALFTAAAIAANPHSLQTSAARLTYTKVLKGSTPEYTRITVDANGAGLYEGRKLSDAPAPQPLKLSPSTTEALFRLAHELQNFKSLNLEASGKVADLGEKTLIYEESGQKYTVSFNFTRNRRAEELVTLFEGIGGVEQHLNALKYSARYDRLGLPDVLNSIEADLDNKALVDPQLLVPMLQKIAAGSAYLHIAQLRAENILRRIQKENDPRHSRKSKL